MSTFGTGNPFSAAPPGSAFVYSKSFNNLVYGIFSRTSSDKLAAAFASCLASPIFIPSMNLSHLLAIPSVILGNTSELNNRLDNSPNPFARPVPKAPLTPVFVMYSPPAPKRFSLFPLVSPFNQLRIKGSTIKNRPVNNPFLPNTQSKDFENLPIILLIESSSSVCIKLFLNREVIPFFFSFSAITNEAVFREACS